MKNFSSITLLRLICCWEVFILHWFARLELRDYMWIWSGAVPCFLLMSAFIYGLRPAENQNWGMAFICKRWKSIAVTYYPFVIAVFAWYAISSPREMGPNMLSMTSELLFVTGVTQPLPGWGQLWFMQTLALCYLMLAVVGRSAKFSALLRQPKVVVLLVILTFIMGGVKRDGTFVYLLFYWLAFVYAHEILRFGKTVNAWVQFSAIIVLYAVFLLHYEDVFWYGIYLRYIHTCIIALLTISLTVRLVEGCKLPKLVCWLSSIAMEVYLVHHLFVFNYPIYVSLPLTILLSLILHQIGVRLKKCFR